MSTYQPRSPYLAICSVLFSPGSHDKRVIDRNASDLLYSFTLQLAGLLHKTREVSLKVTRELQRQQRWLCASCKPQKEKKRKKKKRWHHGLYLGTTRGKGSRYGKEDPLLPLEELIHSHLISWLPLLDLHCGELLTNLAIEKPVNEKVDYHSLLWLIMSRKCQRISTVYTEMIYFCICIVALWLKLLVESGPMFVLITVYRLISTNHFHIHST